MPAATVARMAAVWEQRELLLQALEGLPRCFCHKDAITPQPAGTARGRRLAAGTCLA
jgi:hypothetical protein